MRTVLVVTTYNQPEHLAAALRSAAAQSVAPSELVVADDGSGKETADVVAAAKKRGLPIVHAWREHDGFRAGSMRNRAIRESKGDYIVFVDGDIVMHPEFLADHVAAARPGRFVQGTRAIIMPGLTETALAAERFWPAPHASGIGNRKNLIRSRALSRWFSDEARGVDRVRTCNFAVWRADAVKVNGFDEDFVGWGSEDHEFAARLLNSGVRRYNLRFAGLCCHLHHDPNKNAMNPENKERLRRTVESGKTRCENGLVAEPALRR
ncbi:MAG: glycosyltransferase [Planctomycetota bacterium]|jgi:glycosyltransferase involved in cell wall biosynthesis|nr:glycosyltransferase [Planctomycetota bacterium]